MSRMLVINHVLHEKTIVPNNLNAELPDLIRSRSIQAVPRSAK